MHSTQTTYNLIDNMRILLTYHKVDIVFEKFAPQIKVVTMSTSSSKYGIADEQ